MSTKTMRVTISTPIIHTPKINKVMRQTILLLKQQTLAINASKHPTNEYKNIQNTSNGHNHPNPTSTWKYTTKVTRKIRTIKIYKLKKNCLLEGANMKPIVIKLWKRHNLIINLHCWWHHRNEVLAITPRKYSTNPTLPNPSCSNFKSSSFKHPTSRFLHLSYNLPCCARSRGCRVFFHRIPLP